MFCAKSTMMEVTAALRPPENTLMVVPKSAAVSTPPTPSGSSWMKK
jgi:hypothetical protein